jgi:hypothetical protein
MYLVVILEGTTYDIIITLLLVGDKLDGKEEKI